jgi:predicted anti-sigma-YlaC factor YlaD
VPTCRDVSEKVTDYLERALPTGQWLGVRWHLLQCDACRRYVRQMRQTMRLLAESVLSPPATGIEDSVLRAAGAVRPDSAPGD